MCFEKIWYETRAYLQLVRNPDDSSLDPYSPGTCTIRDQLLELPLYEDTTSGDHYKIMWFGDSE